MLTKPTSFHSTCPLDDIVRSLHREGGAGSTVLLSGMKWSDSFHSPLMLALTYVLCIVCWGFWVPSTWWKLGPWTTAHGRTLNIFWFTGLWHEQDMIFSSWLRLMFCASSAIGFCKILVPDIRQLQPMPQNEISLFWPLPDICRSFFLSIVCALSVCACASVCVCTCVMLLSGSQEDYLSQQIRNISIAIYCFPLLTYFLFTSVMVKWVYNQLIISFDCY